MTATLTSPETRDPVDRAAATARPRRPEGPLLWMIGGGLTLALLASIVLATTVGVADLTAGQVWQSISHHLGLGGERLSGTRDAIVWEVRLPRVVTAALVGAALALCGAVMQTLTRNQLADPYLLGLSSGAALGAVSVLLLGLSLALPIAAFAGAVLALLAALALSGPQSAGAPGRVVLAGIAVAQIASAATSFVIFLNAKGDSYREVLSWLMGSLGSAQWERALPALPVVVLGAVVLLGFSRSLDAFAFGDVAAESLGIDVRRTRIILLLLVSLLTGTAVAISGAIGFVGLVLPHAVRFLTGPGHFRLLLALVPVGAIFLIWTDTLARTVLSGQEIPVGVVTGLIGAPVFCLLLWKQRGR